MKIGILLINLGTPEKPTLRAVRSYLREFLSDPKVIDLAWLPRQILVNLILLTRAKQSLEAYQTIWLAEGSPLLVHMKTLQQALSQCLGNHCLVEIAMRYGAPSIADGLRNLSFAEVDKIIVLALFPQYSRAVTGSVLEVLSYELKHQHIKTPIKIVEPFFNAPGYIEANAELIKQAMDDIQAEYLLMSYHGLPERQMRYNPNYQQDCFATSSAIAKTLGLSKKQYQTSFQSRLGRTPWIRPYTEEVLAQLRKEGISRIAVACPSFVVDCLETLEEIGIRAREQWLSLGGEAFKLVPCLNDSTDWLKALLKPELVV